MTPKPRRAEIAAPVSVLGLELKTLEHKPIESEQEKAQRLRKEMLNFYFKDVLTWAIGCLFIVLAVLYGFSVLIRTDSLPADKERARSAFMAILGGIVGLLFGKAAK
jgi:hypothetical protein